MTKTNASKTTVAAYLSAQPTTVAAMADAAGLSKAATRRALAALVDSGDATRVADAKPAAYVLATVDDDNADTDAAPADDDAPAPAPAPAPALPQRPWDDAASMWRAQVQRDGAQYGGPTRARCALLRDVVDAGGTLVLRPTRGTGKVLSGLVRWDLAAVAKGTDGSVTVVATPWGRAMLQTPNVTWARMVKLSGLDSDPYWAKG